MYENNLGHFTARTKGATPLPLCPAAGPDFAVFRLLSPHKFRGPAFSKIFFLLF